MKGLSKLLGLSLGICCTTSGWAQQLEWAYSIQDIGVQNNAQSIAANGNNFAICGSVNNAASYDLINQNPAYSGAKCFVAYYNENAEIQWMVPQPTDGTFERVSALNMNASGALYAIGRFNGTQDFDPGAGTTQLTSNWSDVFVQKFDNAGNFQWVGHARCDGQPRTSAIKSNGNIVVIGRLQDTTTVVLTGGSSVPLEKGVFIIEFAANGDAIAAYSLATPDSFSDQTAIAIDANDNVYIGCSVDGNMDLDLKSGVLAETSNSGYDCVLVKYDANYDYVWHKRFGDAQTSAPDGWDFINDLKVYDGYLYATGWFTWTTDFDPDNNPGQWVYTADDNTQSPDGFVVKYGLDGTIQWVQEAGGHPSIVTNTDVWYQDMVIANGQIIVSGELNGTADFDGSANDFILGTADNGLGLCYVHYDTDGNFQNAWLIDGIVSANEKPRGIELLANGFVAYGTFQKECDFDPGPGQFILETDPNGPFYSADNDLFVAHYSISGIGGIQAQELSPLKAWPNPTEGIVFLSSEVQFEGGKVFDIYGKECGEFDGTIVDLSAQPAGIYVIKIPGRAPIRIVKH